MKQISICLLCIVFIALCMSACAPVATEQEIADEPIPAAETPADEVEVPINTPQPSASPTPEPTPEPTPTPKPLTAEEVLDEVLATNILNFIPADTYVIDETVRYVDTITSQPDVAYNLPKQYINWIQANTLQSHPLINTVSLEARAPHWKLLSVLVYHYGSQPDVLSRALKEACEFNTLLEYDSKSGFYEVTVTVQPKNPMELIYSLPDTDTISRLHLSFSYAYLATLYDNDMNFREGIDPRELEPLLFPIDQPERWYFVDCWFDDRDGGTRRHTGTDINADEGTHLLAAVDCTVKSVGDGPGTGFYVVLEGTDGTQYHYYHMVEPSPLQTGQKVKQGDVVGYVGNTGNSTANHLHFTIITQDGYYLNPYPYLLESHQQATQ